MQKLIILAVLGMPLSLAAAGVGAGGGGDVCENRIKIIRDDLGHWIKNGGPANLELPADWNPSSYSEAMLRQLPLAKISCVGPGDPGFPVAVDGIPKTCRFQVSPTQTDIFCDSAKLLANPESSQYVIIHHEYAGAAGIEKPDGASSNYSVSNQLSSYLVDEVIKKLAVKKPRNTVTVPEGADIQAEGKFAGYREIPFQLGARMTIEDQYFTTQPTPSPEELYFGANSHVLRVPGKNFFFYEKILSPIIPSPTAPGSVPHEYFRVDEETGKQTKLFEIVDLRRSSDVVHDTDWTTFSQTGWEYDEREGLIVYSCEYRGPKSTNWGGSGGRKRLIGGLKTSEKGSISRGDCVAPSRARPDKDHFFFGRFGSAPNLPVSGAVFENLEFPSSTDTSSALPASKGTYTADRNGDKLISFFPGIILNRALTYTGDGFGFFMLPFDLGRKLLYVDLLDATPANPVVSRQSERWFSPKALYVVDSTRPQSRIRLAPSSSRAEGGLDVVKYDRAVVSERGHMLAVTAYARAANSRDSILQYQPEVHFYDLLTGAMIGRIKHAAVGKSAGKDRVIITREEDLTNVRRSGVTHTGEVYGHQSLRVYDISGSRPVKLHSFEPANDIGRADEWSGAMDYSIAGDRLSIHYSNKLFVYDLL